MAFSNCSLLFSFSSFTCMQQRAKGSDLLWVNSPLLFVFPAAVLFEPNPCPDHCRTPYTKPGCSSLLINSFQKKCYLLYDYVEAVIYCITHHITFPSHLSHLSVSIHMHFCVNDQVNNIPVMHTHSIQLKRLLNFGRAFKRHSFLAAITQK